LTIARAVKELIGRHVRQDEANHLGRIELLGNLNGVHVRHADTLRVGAPDGERRHPVSHSQPGRAAGAELLDDADELIAGGEWRLRHAQIRAGAQLSIGKRHPRCQHPNAQLADPRPRIALLHHRQHLGTAIAVHHHALHHLLPSFVRAAPAVGGSDQSPRRDGGAISGPVARWHPEVLGSGRCARHEQG
jgi:hypothetical protein